MPENSSDNREALVALSHPRSPIAEAYRQLRTNIQFSTLDKPLRTLLVTSTSPEEGKSTTLANLAITIAQTGSTVILADCDLRRPTIHELFGVRNGTGLTSVLIDTSAEEFPFQDSSVPNLRLLPSGPLPPNPAELLGSRRMTELIDRLKAQADFVLFDSPPIIAVTDAAVLATKMDGVLLVIKAGKTKHESAKRAKDLLDKVNANLLGVVLNNARYEAEYQHYYADRD